MSAIYHRVYLYAYGGWEAPGWLRRALVRTEFHRAWLSGFHGRFEQAGMSYGPANPFPALQCVDRQKTEWSDHLVRNGLPRG